jgi:hypothetical protein
LGQWLPQVTKAIEEEEKDIVGEVEVIEVITSTTTGIILRLK